MLSKKHHPSVGRAAISGIVWTIIQTFSGKASTLIGQLILAKILVPEDFGVIGLASTIATLFGVLSESGVGQTMQQRHPRMHLWSTQTFWITLILCSISAITMAVYAPIGAKLYHNSKITILVWVLAVNLPLGALWTLPVARLQSQLKFNFMAIYSSGEAIVLQALTILCAWKGLGALSFVLPIPLITLVRTVVYWSVAPVPLRPFKFSKGWGLILKRSSGILGSSILTLAIGQGDYVTLGLLTSTQVVGIYYFAFKLSSQPMIMLSNSFANVLRPALVALKDDQSRQCEAAIKTGQLLGLLTVPLCYLQAAIARPALTLLFGSRWLESIPLVQILSISLPLASISLAATTLLFARGQNAKLFRYQLIFTPFFFIFIGIGALIGSALGVAIGVTVYYTLQPVLLAILVFSEEGINIRRIFSLFYTPVILGCTTIGSAYIASQMASLQNAPLAQIAVTIFVGGGAYILAFRQFSPHLYKDLSKKLLGMLKR